MIRQDMYTYGAASCGIRELHEYGVQQAAKIGAENVYDFTIGNPSVPTPDAVTKKFSELLQTASPQSLHSYTSAAGDLSVRDAIAKDLSTRSSVTVCGENLFLTCGSSSALTAVIWALAIEGAEFLVPCPYFPEYRPFIEASGAKFIPVPADTTHFDLNLSALAERITAHTQAVIVNSPNNPSGVVYSRETLKKLAALLEEKSREYAHPIYILSDEPYRELVYDGAEVPFIPELYANTVVCYSYSKSLSMPGDRLGYFCIPDSVADAKELYLAASGAARIQGHICAPSLLQKVIASCTDLRPELTVYDANRRMLYEALSAYGYRCVKPQGAFYLFVQSPSGDGKEFSDRAKQENLLVVPGEDFGVNDYVRVSTCVSHETVERSLPVFKKLMQSYQK